MQFFWKFSRYLAIGGVKVSDRNVCWNFWRPDFKLSTTMPKRVRFVEDEGGGPSDGDQSLLKMSKRRRENEARAAEGDAYFELGRKLEPRPNEKQTGIDSKHTLDSDEEEDEKYDRLDVTNVEGQESATMEFDDETKITPFNMKEEMDEGHFDADGTFIFDKKNEQIKDAWLDNIDWGKIKKDAGGLWQGRDVEEEGEGDEEDNADDQERSQSPPSIARLDRSDVYEKILTYLRPQETITKALKRLGGSRATADVRQARWRQKKDAKKAAAMTDESTTPLTNQQEGGQDDQHKSSASSSAPAETSLPVDEQAETVAKLTELIDGLVDEGEFEIYGYTYERINHELEKIRTRKALQAKSDERPKESTIVKDDSDGLDMFADEIDVKELKATPTPIGPQAPAPKKKTEEKTEKAAPETSSNDVRWEFKWKNEDGAEIFGPCSTQQMFQWTEEGYFKDGVWVRRLGQDDSSFYSSKRIDFDLYL